LHLANLLVGPVGASSRQIIYDWALHGFAKFPSLFSSLPPKE